MKKLYIISLALIALVATSCNDWLDVSPRSDVEDKDLFKTESGFKSALTGVYLMMADEDLYGKNTTMFLPEALMKHWNYASGEKTKLSELSEYNYKYSDVEPLLADVWKSYYKCIVQLNHILANLDETKIGFDNNNDKLIRGEALALRGFLHFEVLRLYGPIPNLQAGGSSSTIPYVREVTKNSNSLISLPYGEVVQKIEEDLTAGEELLKEYDLITKVSNENLNMSLDAEGKDLVDNWQGQRQGRFNYYAVLATKARLYHWTSDVDLAVEYAQKTLDAVGPTNAPQFRLTSVQDMQEGSESINRVYYSEQLFGVYNSDLSSISFRFFEGKTPYLTTKKEYIESAFGIGALTGDDVTGDFRNKKDVTWRSVQYPGNASRVIHFKKYSESEAIPSISRIPVIRLSEMYFILIQNLPYAQGKVLFHDYLRARGISQAVIDPMLANTVVMKDNLVKQYRKEFFGEGQIFFYFKKYEILTHDWPYSFTMESKNYVLPKPQGQISFE